MRQAGVIAAAARVALETGPDRLVEDHANAARLADALADIDPGIVDLPSVETNMVYVDLAPLGRKAPEVRDALLEHGVLTLGAPGTSMRLVTHRDVDSTGLDKAIEAFRRVLA